MRFGWPVFLAMFLPLTCLAGCMGDPYTPDPGTTYVERDVYHCTLHDRPLRLGSAPVEYGLFRPTREQVDPEMLHFPNANTWTEGGCSWEPGFSPERKAVWYCPSCRRAEAQYRKAHPDTEAAARPPPNPYVDADGTELTTARLLEVALSRTESDEIRHAWEELHRRLREAEQDAESQEAADAIVQLAKKLEAGWPGFIGPVVALNRDKTHRRQTPHERLAHCYTHTLMPIDAFRRAPRVVETYLRMEPAGGDLRQEWLSRSDLNIIFGGTTPAGGRPVHEVGGDGVTYTQDRHTIRSGVVIRQILVDTGASRHALLTVLLDEERYPAQSVFEARRSHGLPMID